MTELPKVSIIIPCRNERKFISVCLDSIIASDYPKENLEILVIDGESKDKTQDIVREYISKHSFIKLLENPKHIASSALNIGIKKSKGDIVIRMDAHATYSKDYISKCVNYLLKYNADNVGGVISVIPRENNLIGRGIARSLSSSFGTGGAKYKTGLKDFEEVDTVPFGCFKREAFEKVGLFNENLARSQDMDFNIRLKKAGGKIYLFSDIISYYYVRSNLKDFFVHNFKDGIWATYPLKFIKTPFKLRHYIPLALVSGLVGSLLLGIFIKPFFYIFFITTIIYLFAMIYSSAKISFREKNVGFLISLPIAFITRHFSYGFGSIVGIIKLLI